MNKTFNQQREERRREEGVVASGRVMPPTRAGTQVLLGGSLTKVKRWEVQPLPPSHQTSSED